MLEVAKRIALTASVAVETTKLAILRKTRDLNKLKAELEYVGSRRQKEEKKLKQMEAHRKDLQKDVEHAQAQKEDLQRNVEDAENKAFARRRSLRGSLLAKKEELTAEIASARAELQDIKMVKEQKITDLQSWIKLSSQCQDVVKQSRRHGEQETTWFHDISKDCYYEVRKEKHGRPQLVRWKNEPEDIDKWSVDKLQYDHLVGAFFVSSLGDWRGIWEPDTNVVEVRNVEECLAVQPRRDAQEHDQKFEIYHSRAVS